MRYLLQRARTEEWLTRDFELSDATRTRGLSSAGGINGTITPEWQHAIAPDGKPYLLDFSTIVYAQDDNNRIVNAGIVENISYNEQGQLQLEAPGFSRYPQGIPYSSIARYIHADPIAVVAKHLWDHVQSFPNGDLGVVLVAPATPETLWIGDNETPYALSYWENSDVGGEFDSLAQQTPFDYVEDHFYTNADLTDVSHRITIGFPRIGRKRTDLRFAEGENIVGPVTPAVAGSEFANELIGIGRGEGSAMIHGQIGVDDGRLRRPKVLTDKLADQARLDALLRSTLQQLKNVTDITGVTVQDSPNAPLSAFIPGDDILVQASLPWLGPVRYWERIISITESDTAPDRAELELRRSDSFIYSATTGVA